MEDGMFLRLYMYAATIYEEESEAGVPWMTYTILCNQKTKTKDSCASSCSST